MAEHLDGPDQGQEMPSQEAPITSEDFLKLVKAMQEQSKVINEIRTQLEDKDALIAKKDAQLADLATRFAELSDRIDGIESGKANSDVALVQTSIADQSDTKPDTDTSPQNNGESEPDHVKTQTGDILSKEDEEKVRILKHEIQAHLAVGLDKEAEEAQKELDAILRVGSNSSDTRHQSSPDQVSQPQAGDKTTDVQLDSVFKEEINQLTTLSNIEPNPTLVMALDSSAEDWATKRAIRDRLAIAVKAPSAEDLRESGELWTNNLSALQENMRNIYNGLIDSNIETIRQKHQEFVDESRETGINDIDAYLNNLREQMTNNVEAALEGYRVTKENEFVNMVATESVRLAEVKKPLARKLLNWWAKQGGGEKFFSKHRIIGNIKKGLALALPGALIGMATVPLASAVGLAGGAVFAGAIATGVARGLMGSKLNSLADNNETISDARAKATLDELQTKRDKKAETSEDYRFDNTVNEKGEKNVRRNQKRFAIAGAIGAISAFGGRWASQGLIDWLWPNVGASAPNPPVSGGDNTPPLSGGGNNPPVVVTPNNPPTIFSSEFMVENGSGVIRELQDLATANGGVLSDNNAFLMYKDLINSVGTQVIDLKATPQIDALYSRGNGDWGISAPGQAVWSNPAKIWLENNYQKYIS